MKGLILKDFINLKRNFKIFGVLSLLYTLLAITSKDTGFLSGVITMLFAILTLSLYSYDDLAKWDIFALTMPITKEDMVRSKYIMLILLTLLGTAFSSIVSISINIVIKKVDFLDPVSNSLIGAFVVIVLYSILLPFIIKFGVEKARLILFITMFIPFVIASIINAIVKEGISDISGGLVKVFDFISRYYFILLPLTALAILYVSYRISVRIYRRKEF